MPGFLPTAPVSAADQLAQRGKPIGKARKELRPRLTGGFQIPYSAVKEVLVLSIGEFAERFQ